MKQDRAPQYVLSRAYQMMVDAFPVLAGFFAIRNLWGGKSKRNGPAVHQNHLPYLANFFALILKPASDSDPVKQMELSFPSTTYYSKPLPPGLPLPPPLPEELDIPSIPGDPRSGSTYPVPTRRTKYAREARAGTFASSVVVACPPVAPKPEPSTSPYGWRSEKGRLSLVPKEQLVVRLIEKRYYRGASFDQIASELLHAGYLSRTGQRWTHKEIKAIIKRNDMLWQRWAEEQGLGARD